MNTQASAELEYVGFWARFGAFVIDSLWIAPVVMLLGLLYERSGDSASLDQLLSDPAHVSTGALASMLTSASTDFLSQSAIGAVLVLLFWFVRSATPGQMVLGARIVDARTGGVPSKGQLLLRYLAYYLSTLPCCLGFVWIGWDPRKQGWHDKIAGTVVVRPTRRHGAAASFPGGSGP